jgi:hypothetical protein
MENDVKKTKKVARCVRAMLEFEGTKVTTNSIFGLIKDEDLSDVIRLKGIVAEHLTTTPEQNSYRRGCLKTFIAKNWEQVKDNEPVKTALLNAYCMGRYNKERRQQMVSELLAECEK